jgi:Flp pilus assembly pilin Flp
MRGQMRIGAQLARAVAAVIADDGGQDLIEYALLTAIIGIAGLLAFSAFSAKMGPAYIGWYTAGQVAWEPPCPQSAPC